MTASSALLRGHTDHTNTAIDAPTAKTAAITIGGMVFSSCSWLAQRPTTQNLKLTSLRIHRPPTEIITKAPAIIA